jgi:hypothetical protein
MQAAPDRTFTLMQVGDRQAIGLMQTEPRALSALSRQLVRKGARGFAKLRLVSRPTKFIATGGMTEVGDFFRSVLLTRPNLRPIGLLAGALAAITGFLMVAPRFLLRRVSRRFRARLRRASAG